MKKTILWSITFLLILIVDFVLLHTLFEYIDRQLYQALSLALANGMITWVSIKIERKL